MFYIIEYFIGNEMTYIAAEISNLLDQAGAEIHILGSSCQKYRFSSCIKLLIGKSHLEFIFKVTDSSESLHDSHSSNVSHVIRKKSVKYIYNHVI